ncbi:DUF899 family protein [Chitinophagales bacterium]|nr:DUF899 family protein [Chitinophagales bacterium]
MSEILEQIKSLELDIQDKKQELAHLRKKLEPSLLPDYRFKDKAGKEHSLAELFGDKDEMLVVYNMGESCAYCTLWADNYNGIAKPLKDRAAFIVVSPDAPEKMKAFAESRDWNFDIYSHKESPFAKDMKMITEKGMFWPGVSSLSKTAEGIFVHHTTSFGPGDNFCNMWDFIDMLPAGVNGWKPKYKYD